MDYKSRKKIYYEIIRPHLKFKVNEKEKKKRFINLRIENGNIKCWELTILSINIIY